MKALYYLISRVIVLLPLIQPVSSSADESLTINSTDTLSSSQLVTAVLQANPRLGVAQASWQVSLAKVAQQSALDDPQFHYSFAPLTINSQKPDGQNAHFGQRFEISQRIPFPGKLQLRGKAAEYQAKAQQQDITALRLLLATQAKTLFADWYFIHQAIAINKSSQTLLNRSLDIALSRYSTGKFSKHDVLRAEMERVLIKHQAITFKRELKTILAQLNTLLNRPPESPLPMPQKLLEITQLPELEQLQANALQSRPEIKVIVATADMHKAQTELAGLAYYPDIKLSTGYNSLWDNEDKRFNIGIGINIPLDQSKRLAAEQEAKANYQHAHWRKIDLDAKIREEVVVAYAYVEESLQTMKLYQQQLLPLAEDNRLAAKTAYQAGKGEFSALISSEKNALQIQLQSVQALADSHRHLAGLEHATGNLDSLLAVNKTGNSRP